MDNEHPAADVEWRMTQQNTFTRWCNEHLRTVGLCIDDLETDLSDGLKLIALLQVLSGKTIDRFNKKPRFKMMMIENIQVAYKFMEAENIKFCGIDARDILDGNLRIIVGVIWLLILKYHIPLPVLDGRNEASEEVSPKQALIEWVNNKLPPEVVVSNFSTDWNSGVAIGALLDAVAPGLFPEWEHLDPTDGIKNAREAMKVADDWLSVPQVITPEEIASPNVDRLAVMTYVSYFPKAKLKDGAPLKSESTRVAPPKRPCDYDHVEDSDGKRQKMAENDDMM